MDAETERHELLDRLADLTAENAALKARMAMGAQRNKKGDGDDDEEEEEQLHPWNWRTMPPELVVGAWGDLRAWVGWLTERFQLEALILPCWYRHSTIVEVLTELRWAWEESYVTPSATGRDAMYWVDALMRQRSYLEEFVRLGCTESDHVSRLPRVHRDDGDWQAWLAEQGGTP